MFWNGEVRTTVVYYPMYSSDDVPEDRLHKVQIRIGKFVFEQTGDKIPVKEAIEIERYIDEKLEEISARSKMDATEREKEEEEEKEIMDRETINE